MTEGQQNSAGRPRPPWLSALRFVVQSILSVFLILWTLLDALLFPLVRPLLDALGRLRLFALIETGLGRLPPYPALLALAVPFVIIEPIKAFALYWFGIGHFFQGAVLYVLSHLASILIVERVYHAAHEPLMRIDWFKRLMAWLDRIRHISIDWAKSTTLWQTSARFAREVKATVRGWLRALR
ncbi:MAG: hypothetical protein P4M09_09755 [Devosia sp.]|nr:hypothetical protein [Devosia sp.]